MIERILHITPVRILLTFAFVSILFLIMVADYLPWAHRLENYANQLMLFYLFGGLLFLMLRQRYLVMMSFGCCAALCVYLKLAVSPDMDGFDALRKTNVRNLEPVDFTVAHFNMEASSSESEIITTIRSINADLVSIQEVRPDIMKNLIDSLREDYFFHESITDMRMLGMCVFAKRPFLQFDTLYHEGLANPCGSLVLGKNGEGIHFVTTNTFPAFDKTSFDKIRTHLKTLTNHLDTIKAPIIIMGDFNAAPWSNIIQDFETDTDLKDSRGGFMAALNSGTKSFWGLPVNHIFHSEHLRCIDFETLSSDSFSGIKGVYRFKIRPKYVGKEN